MGKNPATRKPTPPGVEDFELQREYPALFEVASQGQGGKLGEALRIIHAHLVRCFETGTAPDEDFSVMVVCEELIKKTNLSQRAIAELSRLIVIYELSKQLEKGTPAHLWRSIIYLNWCGLGYPPEIRSYLGCVAENLVAVAEHATCDNAGAATIKALGFSGWAQMKRDFGTAARDTLVRLFSLVEKDERAQRLQGVSHEEAVAKRLQGAGVGLGPDSVRAILAKKSPQ